MKKRKSRIKRKRNRTKLITAGLGAAALGGVGLVGRKLHKVRKENKAFDQEISSPAYKRKRKMYQKSGELMARKNAKYVDLGNTNRVRYYELGNLSEGNLYSGLKNVSDRQKRKQAAQIIKGLGRFSWQN